MNTGDWRESVAKQLIEAGEALRQGRYSDCAIEFGVALGYLQSAARSGTNERARRLLERLREQSAGDDETQQLRLEPEQLKALIDERDDE